MGFIYGIENKINNLWYIGQTIQQPETRWKQHVGNYNSKMAICVAIKTFGVDNFNFVVLGEYPNTMLDEKEKEEIIKHDSFHNGYNSTYGGSSKRGEKFIIPHSYDEVIEYYNNHPQKSLREIENDLKLGHRTVSEILKAKGIIIRKPGIKVVLTKEDIKEEFDNISSAAKFLFDVIGIKVHERNLREGIKRAMEKEILYHGWKVYKR